MIKKSLFENDLINGMHSELTKHGSKSVDLEQAVDCLNSSIDILEDIGLTAQADHILSILSKIAALHKVMRMPPIPTLIEAGMKLKDIEDLSTNQFAKARVNKAFRNLGYSDQQIIDLIGKHHFMGQKETDELTDPSNAFGKIMEWFKAPKKVSPSGELKPGEEISISKLPLKGADCNQSKSVDPHTKGLTSEKMVKNLLHHGTEFNMVDDLLNLEVGDGELEVSEKDMPSEMDFEDEL